MSRLANWMARITWFWLIQWMRKPWMRRVHLSPMRWIKSEEKRAKFIENYKQQNKFARRIGIPLLRAVYFAFLAVFAIQVTYSSAMWLVDSGYLMPPSLEEFRIHRE